MIHRIPSVMGIILVSMLALSVLTDRIVHAQEQSSPSLLNSDARIQADIVFWQAIEDSEDHRDLKDYLEQFPNGQFVRLVQRRLQARIDANGRTLLLMHGDEAMFVAARDNDIDNLEWLTAQGADVNARASDDKTPTHHAAAGNAVDAMEWLKARGGDINARDSSDETPMHHAARGNAVNAMEWLKAQGADINAQDFDGRTPMHHAAWSNAVGASEWLAAQGADINARDSSDLTPLHHAAWGNAVSAMEWLAAQGADINARDSSDGTPMHLAAWGNAVDAMEWLKTQGAISTREIPAMKLRCTLLRPAMP